MAKLDYRANIVRGWPNDGAMEDFEPIASGVTVSNGDFVVKDSNGNVVKQSATGAGNGQGQTVGLVLRGNGDSGSGAASGAAQVLWSNYIVQYAVNPGSLAPGNAVTIDNNTIRLAAGTDSIYGYVKNVSSTDTYPQYPQAGASVTTGSLTILVR